MKCPWGCGWEGTIEEYSKHVEEKHMEDLAKRKPGIKIVPISPKLAKYIAEVPEFLAKRYRPRQVVYLIFIIDTKIISEDEILAIQREITTLSHKHVKYGIESALGRHG